MASRARKGGRVEASAKTRRFAPLADSLDTVHCVGNRFNRFLPFSESRMTFPWQQRSISSRPSLPKLGYTLSCGRDEIVCV